MRKGSGVLVLMMLAMGSLFLTANPLLAGTVDLPKTGQTTCYSTYDYFPISCMGSGQDGNIQAGVAWPVPRFTDNKDGTVTDNLTGLMWLKDARCLGAEGKTWEEALEIATKFNAKPWIFECQEYIAEYHDWVLPNVNELASLFNGEVSHLATWLNQGAFLNVQPSYWSSTSLAKTPTQAWAADMAIGGIASWQKIAPDHYVWLVRGSTAPPAAVWQTGQTACYDVDGLDIPCADTGQDGDLQRGVEWPTPRFTEHKDGTVTDNLTGLMWLKDVDCFDTQIWREGFGSVSLLNEFPEFCPCKDYVAGYTDWRLPNINELHSLISYGSDRLALPPNHPFLIDTWLSGICWSSTTSTHDPYDKWGASMGYGSLRVFSNGKNGKVWPVRSGEIGPVLQMAITGNGRKGSVCLTPSEPLTVEINIDPCQYAGDDAEWWIVARQNQQFGIFEKRSFHSYIYPSGWFPGIEPCIQMPLKRVSPHSVLHAYLPTGEYEFFFLVDRTVDGIPEGNWLDSLKVTVR